SSGSAGPATASVAITTTGVSGTGDADTGYTQYVLTFDSGAGVLDFDNTGGDGNTFTRLKDGLWRLDAVGAKIHAGAHHDATPADRSDVFWSLFGMHEPGDVLEDGGNVSLYVDGLGLSDIYAALGAQSSVDHSPWYDPSLDYNLDGANDGVDA